MNSPTKDLDWYKAAYKRERAIALQLRKRIIIAEVKSALK